MKRRDFLTQLTIALIAAPVLLNSETKALSFDEEVEKRLAGLVSKFDRLSPKGRQQLIDAFDVYPLSDNAEDREFDIEIIKDLQDYFRKRKAALEVAQ